MVGMNDRPEMSNKWETQGRNPGMMVRSARRSKSLGLSSPSLHNNETSLNTQPPRSVFFHFYPVPSFPSRLTTSRSSFASSWLTVLLHFRSQSPSPPDSCDSPPLSLPRLSRRENSPLLCSQIICAPTTLFCPQVGSIICYTFRIAVK